MQFNNSETVISLVWEGLHCLANRSVINGLWSEALERLLSDDFEADQRQIDALESEDIDAGGADIQGYLPETVLVWIS